MKFNYKPQGKSIIITLLFIMFFISNVTAQKESTPISSITTTKVKSEKWQLLISNEFVDINYRYAECNLPTEGTHKENVYLQIKNKTDKNIICDWTNEYWYNDVCSGCQGSNPEYNKSTTLMPNQTKEGSCSPDKNLHVFQIFSKMVNYDIGKLTNFNLKNIKVNILN